MQAGMEEYNLNDGLDNLTAEINGEIDAELV